jgi:hypothetical protein
VKGADGPGKLPDMVVYVLQNLVTGTGLTAWDVEGRCTRYFLERRKPISETPFAVELQELVGIFPEPFPAVIQAEFLNLPAMKGLRSGSAVMLAKSLDPLWQFRV